MHLNIGLISLFLCLKINEVTSNNFFLLERGDDNWQQFSTTESLFTCDRDKGCTHVKYDKGTKQFTLTKEGDHVSDTANDNEIVWRKVLQIFVSCKEALLQGINGGVYWIQHKNMFTPIEVKCQREGGKVLAVLHHDSEARIQSKGSEAPGSNVHVIKYNINFQDIAAFVDSSTTCKQFTKIDCYGMRLDGFGYLVDREGNPLSYIGGGPANGTGCSCGITNTCAVTGNKCNCDANDDVWRFDEGYVTEKARLPLTQVRLGDTGDVVEEGAHTIGKLICED